MKLPTSLILALLAFVPLFPIIVSAGDEPGVIVMEPDSSGVKLLGEAKVREVPARPGKANQVQQQMIPAGTRMINLGTWQKETAGESAAEFTPSLPASGHYDVYVRIWTQNQRSKDARLMRITVSFDGGGHTFVFPEESNFAWIFLGTYPLKKDATAVVRADAQNTFGGSGVLGVKFVPVADPKKALADRPLVLPAGSGGGDEFDKLRLQAVRLFTAADQADVRDPRIANAVASRNATNYLLWKAMVRAEGQVTLWHDLPVDMGKPIEKNEGGDWRLTQTFQRLAALTEAYVGANAPLGFAEKMRGNPELLDDILHALKWLYEKRYNESSINKMGGDWIGMQQLNPIQISRILLMLGSKVPQDLVSKQIETMEKQLVAPDRYYGNFISTGFNRFNGVYAYALMSIVKKDDDALDRVAGLMAAEYGIASRAKPLDRTGAPGADEEAGEGAKPQGKGKAQGGDAGGASKKGGSKSVADGYYADGSFIQHGDLPYIGIYGRGLLDRFAAISSLLANSRWEVKDPRAHVFYDYVYRGYVPLFFEGEIMYGSLGRSTGQSWHQNGAVSSEIMNALVQLVPGAPPEDAARLKAVFKHWMQAKAGAAYPQFSKVDLNRIAPAQFVLLQQIANDPAVQPERPPLGTTFYHNTDYLVHHQPDFAAHLRMFSTRIRTHEDINEGTNRFGWYQGFGTLVIYNRDNSRFHDHFWATVNPYRLPGTTVDTRPREAAGSRNGDLSSNPWAGGASVAGFSLASMELADPGSSLTARKAWVFIDDQIVCLGADIRSSDGRTIETIVENAKLHGEAADYPFVVDGREQPREAGWTAELSDVKWAHLGGKVKGSDLGWVFPGGSGLRALREARQGRWTDSFVKDADIATHTRNYLTLWYDHGSNPSGKDYAYIILPGRTAEQTKAYAAAPAVEVVQNSAQAQAVRSAGAGVTAVNFWEAGTAAGVTASGKAAVLLVEKAGELALAVADPTQLDKSVEITLDRAVKGVVTVDPAMEVVSQSPLKVKVNVEQAEGRSIVGRFQR